ncbi:MAG: glycosyltransferase family 39 protein [Candidatus Saganbacteria bacterium]|nr:glycosyltransferase family 39 protein [Candidatus Saganbacteria bacterium]
MPLILWIILITLSLLRIILGSLFPITADEAYYWLWSKHLALSYVDHPPAIAYINFFFTRGLENLFLLRLSATLFALATSTTIYFISKKLFNEKVAFWSAVLFQIIPHFFFIWLTTFVDIPLVFFWSLSLLFLIMALKEEKRSAWYLLAISVGLGSLCKYSMFLFWPALALCLILIKEHRHWLFKKEPHLAFVLSLLFFAPVIYWNSLHQWVSFTFHAGRTTTETLGVNFLPFVGEQLLQFNPFFLILLIPVLIKAYKDKQILFYFSAPILILFFLLSLKIKIWPHWPSIAYIAAIPLLINYATQKSSRFFVSFIVFIVVFDLIIFSVLFFIDPGILKNQKEYAKNQRMVLIAQQIDNNLKVYAANHAGLSQLEFYLKNPVYLLPKKLRLESVWGEKQFEIFGTPKIPKGETIIYFGPENTHLKEYFDSITEINGVKLYLIEDYISRNKFYILEGYKGNS